MDRSFGAGMTEFRSDKKAEGVPLSYERVRRAQQILAVLTGQRISDVLQALGDARDCAMYLSRLPAFSVGGDPDPAAVAEPLVDPPQSGPRPRSVPVPRSCEEVC